MTAPEHRAITTIWRLEGARIIAAVARLVRDVGTAEQIAQDALVAALETWPVSGIPDNAGAWLMATARNRALDHLRRVRMQIEKHEAIGRDQEAMEAMLVPDTFTVLDTAQSDPIGDDLLRLIFTACHPVLSTEARVALTLRLLGGLTTDEIARAFLVPEKTIAQRIVRAKRTLAEARVPFELPERAELGARLATVLEVIYLIFNEGYTATSGEHWMRPELADEALRLGRVLAALSPEAPEVHGLVALMEFQSSRSAARVDAAGRPVLLPDQDRRRWDPLLIRRGEMALERAREVGGRARPVRAAGGHRELPCASAHGGRNGLESHRGPVRCSGPGHAFAGRGVESCGRGVHGVRSRGRSRNRRPSGGRRATEVISLAAERAGRFSRQARTARRSACRIRTGGIDDAQCAGNRTAARARAGAGKARARRFHAGGSRGLNARRNACAPARIEECSYHGKRNLRMAYSTTNIASRAGKVSRLTNADHASRAAIA